MRALISKGVPSQLQALNRNKSEILLLIAILSLSHLILFKFPMNHFCLLSAKKCSLLRPHLGYYDSSLRLVSSKLDQLALMALAIPLSITELLMPFKFHLFLILTHLATPVPASYAP